MIGGIDAGAKAQRTGEAMLARMPRDVRRAALPTSAPRGSRSSAPRRVYGPRATDAGARGDARGVRHAKKAALELFAREISADGTSAGRPAPPGPAAAAAVGVDVVRLLPS
jgi:hypothetical protein